MHDDTLRHDTSTHPNATRHSLDTLQYTLTMKRLLPSSMLPGFLKTLARGSETARMAR